MLMTGSDLLDWINDYFHDLTHWQDANVLWLIGRTMIICFVLIWSWRIFKSLVKPLVYWWRDFWFRVSPFRKIDRWASRRKQVKAQKQAEEKRRQDEQERARLQVVQRQEQQDAVSAIRQLFKIEDQ